MGAHGVVLGGVGGQVGVVGIPHQLLFVVEVGIEAGAEGDRQGGQFLLAGEDGERPFELGEDGEQDAVVAVELSS